MIEAKYLGLIEMAFTFLVVAGFTAQQLWSLRDKSPPENPTAGDTPAPPPEEPKDP